ncbi:hypothetical protein ABZ612_07640 [Streptomyces avermitilis]|uniref:hypothetical protein n=1 Tax=Streptomyces avermitilis TaxID=33903 RepID=UPI0033FAE891
MTYAASPSAREIARALELQDAHQAARPRTPEQAMGVAAHIYADWRAAHERGESYPDLPSYVRGVAGTGSVTSAERGEVRAFWSWKSQPEGAPREVEHRFLAQACGESRGVQVLEDSPAGSRLDAYWLWEPLVQDVLAKNYKQNPAELKALAPEVWSTVSQRYAEAAEGPVVAFAADIGAESVLGKDELPRLLAHTNVGKENIRFPLPSPRHEHLPPEIDALIADDAVRAQVRMNDFDPAKSPKDFAQKLGGIDVPERLRENHEAALWWLGLADGYDELTARPAEPKRAAANEFLPGVDVRPVARPAAPRGPTGHGVLNPAAALSLPPPAAPVHQPAGIER